MQGLLLKKDHSFLGAGTSHNSHLPERPVALVVAVHRLTWSPGSAPPPALGSFAPARRDASRRSGLGLEGSEQADLIAWSRTLRAIRFLRFVRVLRWLKLRGVTEAFKEGQAGAKEYGRAFCKAGWGGRPRNTFGKVKGFMDSPIMKTSWISAISATILSMAHMHKPPDFCQSHHAICS